MMVLRNPVSGVGAINRGSKNTVPIFTFAFFLPSLPMLIILGKRMGVSRLCLLVQSYLSLALKHFSEVLSIRA